MRQEKISHSPFFSAFVNPRNIFVSFDILQQYIYIHIKTKHIFETVFAKLKTPLLFRLHHFGLIWEKKKIILKCKFKIFWNELFVLLFFFSLFHLCVLALFSFMTSFTWKKYGTAQFFSSKYIPIFSNLFPFFLISQSKRGSNQFFEEIIIFLHEIILFFYNCKLLLLLLLFFFINFGA